MELVISGAAPTHEPVSDYEPKEMTAEELKLAGVTLLSTDSALRYLRCDRCGESWATAYTNGCVVAWRCPYAAAYEFPEELD